MKTILTSFLIVLSSIFCEAKPPKNSVKTNDIVFDEKIPDYVEKWLNDELANTTTTVLENFESPTFFTRNNAKIIGYIKGYDQTQGAKTGMYYYTSELTTEDKPRVIEIHKDGRFELELPLEYPKKDYFLIKNQVISFYVEPGQNLSILLDWQDIKQPRLVSYPLKNVTYKGVLSKINTDLLHYNPSPKSGIFQRKQGVMQPTPYKKYMLNYKTSALNKINGYQQSGVIDKKTFELLENEVLLETYYNLFDYYSSTHSPLYGGGKRKANNIDDTEPKDYYDFISDIPLKKQSILVNQQFFGFVNRLEFAKPFKSKVRYKGFPIAEDFLDFTKEKNVELNLEEKKLLDIVFSSSKKKSQNFSEELKNKIKAFNKKYNTLKKDYSQIISKRIENQKKTKF